MKTTEAQFLRQVRELAKMLGWAFYHPFLSKWSERGWPDVTLVKPPRMILAELKGEGRKPTESQRHWLDLLKQVPGIEVYLWYPEDLEEIAEILRGERRWN